MRMRKKKNLDTRMANCAHWLVEDPAAHRGAWSRAFAAMRADGRQDLPCRGEIGCGKGSFVVGMAQKHPDINFIAVEKVADVLMLAMEKAAAAGVDNVLFVRGDALQVCECFADGELSGLYLNFSDPWPKARHAKRRLTAPAFLEVYRRVLAPGASVEMKTDNDGLFEYSLESFGLCHYQLSQVDRDLHRNGPAPDNVMTEYENNFYCQGKNINWLVATPWKETL